jgi:8-oxo-dGTP pyrophosphatase MutT (NUDIX family)
MAQKYNIYINEKTLIVASTIPNNLQNYQVIDVQEFDFEVFYHSLNNNPYAVFVILSSQPKNILQKIKKSVRVIEAAGGLVQSDEDKYLFIKRNGFWDLPKGKLEIDEKKKDAAVREVEEECGIEVEKLGKKIIKTYHIYELKGKIVLKISHWYKMRAIANQALVPQLEEGITEVKWFGKQDWNLVKANTYASILDVLTAD